MKNELKEFFMNPLIVREAQVSVKNELKEASGWDKRRGRYKPVSVKNELKAFLSGTFSPKSAKVSVKNELKDF